ncbi:MAG: hypothetical protein IJF40_07395 [Clostridia bacterium]|nr:hypothetical protein [Clostridia bacterium]MBQ7047162.1 hypothetical protein [Oscillospiraceae bacterium]
MKKIVRLVAVMLVAAVMVSAFAGCQASLDKAIIGKWTNADNTASVEFKEDGTVTFDFGSVTVLGFPIELKAEGTYTIDVEKEPAEIKFVPDSPINISFIDINLTFTAVYEDDVLTLNSSDLDITLSLTKVEEEK